MLSLAFVVSLFSSQASLSSVDAVTVYHGARTEYVFTAPAIVTVKRPTVRVVKLETTTYIDGCEWYGPRLDGTEVQVCGGSVVAVRLGSDVRTVGGVQ